MKIDKDTLQSIAHLARLEIKPDETDALLKSLDDVLTWMEQLDELDTTGVEPLRHMSQEVNVLREDKAIETISREQALRNAPQHDEAFFKVPKVIE
ncbi:MAG: Asp-tRNA(Asn)/Glu-tRNA(Gln) amidotransferase subunit GatC [Spirosomataceae bacterium]